MKVPFETSHMITMNGKLGHFLSVLGTPWLVETHNVSNVSLIFFIMIASLFITLFQLTIILAVL